MIGLAGFLLLSFWPISTALEVMDGRPVTLKERSRIPLQGFEEQRLLKIEAILKKYKTGLSPRSQTVLARQIYEESHTYGYDPELILALVVRESSFYNWSRSRKGALGLMQILPTTGREVAKAKRIPWQGRKTLFDPQINIKLGTHYLASLHARFGSLAVALTAYNYGPQRVAEMVRRCERLPRQYASRILNTYTIFLDLDDADILHGWNPDLPDVVEIANPYQLFRT